MNCKTSEEDITRPGAVQERLETSASLWDLNVCC